MWHMPSIPRAAIIGDDCYFHVTWQCHNRDWLLKEPWAKQLYYQLLLRYKDTYGVTIYGYCFMENHPHLCGHLRSRDAFSAFFRIVNSLFARTVNKRLGRRGQVVMDRFKSPCVQTDTECLRLMRYIDLNPMRVGKVTHPNQNRWSSYAYYAYGKPDPLITPAPSYVALATTPLARQVVYQSIVSELLRTDWRTKCPYSSVPFIGNPEWVAMRRAELAAVRAEQYVRAKNRRAAEKILGELG